MQKSFLIIGFLLLLIHTQSEAQVQGDTTVYLITCGSGTETYSVYGHNALLVRIESAKIATVYNWGVFDFDAPNFTWNFAKGRLDYWLDTDQLKQFLKTYVYEKRYVWAQKINLERSETSKLISLINENLKPENIKYRYDFFFDDCSTRIRDLLEKAVGPKLLYPPEDKGEKITFRKLVAKHQDPFPWMKFGVDLIMGSPGDKKASFRDRMFLPAYLQSELSQAVVNRDGKMIPLLRNPEVLLDYPAPDVKPNFFKSPVFLFTLLLIIVIIVSAKFKSKKINNVMDLFLYSVFSILAILMVFFNFFTDHQQMRWNLNIIWLNPFILLCLGSIILKKEGTIWFRTVFVISAAFVALQYFLPQEFNIAFLPLTLILLVRSSVRSEFDWNPLSLTVNEERGGAQKQPFKKADYHHLTKI
jgi:hypothetical protein